MRLQILLWPQILQDVILLFHDWIAVPPLNDVEAVRRVHGLKRVALSALISSLLPTVGLALSF